MKTTLMRPGLLSLLALLTLAAAPRADAQTVAWGTSVSFNPIAFNSDGSLDNSVNQWSIGYFADGFVPDATNYLDWGVNYTPVSSLVPEEDPLAPGSGNLVNYPYHRSESGLWSVSVNTYDVGPAAGGKQIYMFAYNDLSLIGTPEGEALLYREDGLLLPSVPNQITFDIADNPRDPVDDNFTVIWGRVDRDTINAGGILRGGGIITALEDADSATGSGNGGFDELFSPYEAQFATWPIPEPSVALLGCIGWLLLLRRRRPGSSR